MASQSSIDAEILKFETNLDRLNSIVNGADTLDVAIDIGTVPSIAKFEKTVQDTVDAIDANVTANKTLAETAATNAGVSETNAGVSAAAALISETNAGTSETNAASAQTAAETARDAALVISLQYEGTSTTSVVLGTGVKAFVTETGKLFALGMGLQVVSAADTSKYFNGVVISYDNVTGNLSLNVLTSAGAGTFADWSIFLSGRDAVGGLLPGNNLSDVASVPVSHDNIITQGADIASAATVDLDAATGEMVDITGATTTTALTLNTGKKRVLRCTGAWPVTAGASLVVDGKIAGTRTFTVNDRFDAVGYAAGVVGLSRISTKPALMDFRDFGALGEGPSHDDWPAMQAAINEAQSSSYPAVFMSPGDYWISQPLVASSSLLEWWGGGVQSRITSSVDGDIIVLDADTGGASLANLSLHDFAIGVDPALTPVACDGIHIKVNATTVTGLTNSRIENIDFFNVTKGIAFDSGKKELWNGSEQLDGSKFNTITNNRIHAYAAVKYGIYWAQGASGHNIITNNQLRGSVIGLKVGDGGPLSAVGDMIVVGNTIISNGGKCVEIKGPSTAGMYNQNVTVVGNQFDGASPSDYLIMTDMSNCTVFPNSNYQAGRTINPWNQFVLENDGITFLEMRTVDTIQTVNASTVLTAISALAFEIQPLEEVRFSLSLRTNSNATANIKLGWAFPVGCAMRFTPAGSGRWNTSGVWTITDELIQTNTLSLAGRGNDFVIDITGYITNGSTAGTITPTFAQNTSDISDTSIQPMSTIRLWREKTNGVN